MVQAALKNLSYLSETDAEIAKLIGAEQQRQENTLELIASENHVSPAVLEAVGSCLTNKYCEGYPGKRYYSGCGNYDEIEALAIGRARKLFGCNYANVQSHSGANANLAVFFALLEPGDVFASIELSDGGHLTHGSPVNLSGKWFKPVPYPLIYDESQPNYGHIDFDALRRVCLEHRPKLIMCGYSVHSRIIDFAQFRSVADECGALLLADIAHIAGLVATGVHPSPFPHCHVVTTTTHKTLRGPRGGMILTNDEKLATQIDKAVFPGNQGGPLMHAIAGKAVAFGEALQPAFNEYCRQIVTNAIVLAEDLMARGYHIVSNGTDNHVMLLDLRHTDQELSGHTVSTWLESAGIIANKNTVPRDSRSPFVTSGLRLGTPALTTRGFKEPQIRHVAGLLDRVINSGGHVDAIAEVNDQVKSLCAQFPLAY
ncbi:MAG: serine hydroxymethyltransferase [Phycisphaeraceae bacterium]|nr:serine hydroxymethyltransferase [Phycisphaeraceae bacterium]